MDYVHIDGLVFRGKHGYYIAERRTEQEFAVSVKMAFDTAPAGVSDKLKDTLDYQKVRKIIGDRIEGNTCYLVEKLAEDICTEILEDKRIKNIELTIKKPAAWYNGTPGITVFRSN
ncbi:MAG: dihydroneopterin aldolase [Candidatus Adlerbacteria bacterium]|nr:dihydroneopterin aldolase [Candidatus Adlerbacteria bacterium]